MLVKISRSVLTSMITVSHWKVKLKNPLINIGANILYPLWYGGKESQFDPTNILSPLPKKDEHTGQVDLIYRPVIDKTLDAAKVESIPPSIRKY